MAEDKDSKAKAHKDQAEKADKPAKKKDKAPAVEAASDKPVKKAKGPKKEGAAPKRAPLTPKTYFAKTGEFSEKWRLVDASGQTLGRLGSYIAMALMGKDKPAYTPFSDTGDFVLVINAEKVKLTGNKWNDKTYFHHTGYPGGIKSTTARELLEKHPERLIENAVWGMLPKSKGHMVRHWFKKLRVFKGSEHPHAAQMPVAATLPNLGSH